MCCNVIEMSSVKEILKKIGHCIYDDWNVERAVITREKFTKLLMDAFGDSAEMPPVYESSRTCNEKWNDLIMGGFATRRNKNSIEFNVERIRDFLVEI